MTPAVSATDTQTIGTTESDALIWEAMMSGTSTQCVPPIIVLTTTGYVGLYARWKDYRL